MSSLPQIKSMLEKSVVTDATRSKTVFFKTGPGEYAEGDEFIGVAVPNLRKIAKSFATLSLEEITCLITSKINEERLLALIILVNQYQKAPPFKQEELYQFYRDNLHHVNNWNLVDASAHLILGAQLEAKNKDILLTLAKSEIMWERRIAIVATWAFIRKNELDWTFKIATILLQDSHDLIHKAVGWMLREAGKRDEAKLVDFLEHNAQKMPRTMLRYAIEKFPPPQRKLYLLKI